MSQQRSEERMVFLINGTGIIAIQMKQYEHLPLTYHKQDLITDEL